MAIRGDIIISSLEKQIAGISVDKLKNLILYKKFQKAKELILNNKNLSIKQIAGIPGFKKTKYFSEKFKTIFGKNSGKIRKEEDIKKDKQMKEGELDE